MRPASYLATVFLSALTMAIAAVVFTVAVDPYRIFNTPTVEGWNDLKPRVYEQANLAKTYQLERVAPNTLLLGNSRVEIGLDPESPLWPKAARPVFNGGEAGTDLESAARLLSDAVAVKPPKTIIVGLDIVDFLQPPPKTETRQPKQIAKWRDYLSATLTIDAVLDSFMTVLDQRPSSSVTMTAHGLNPLREMRSYQQRSGYYGLFAQKNRAYEAQFAKLAHPDFSNPAGVANFRALDTILQLAHQHGSRVILFIHPYHAQFLDLLRRAGYEGDIEAWKRAMRDRVAGSGATLVDFSNSSGETTEAVPPPGDVVHEMRWYWESGHYKPALGEKMIARFVGADDSFGKILAAGDMGPVTTAAD